MRVDRIGYGAGAKDFTLHPNVLRVLVGNDRTRRRRLSTIVVLECEIDDMNPQLFGPLMDRLYDAGALDVFYAPVQMKKNRPGTLVTVMAAPGEREALASVLFIESTTIGVRYQRDAARAAGARDCGRSRRRSGRSASRWRRRDGRVLNAAPEFEDVRAAAAASRGCRSRTSRRSRSRPGSMRGAAAG